MILITDGDPQDAPQIPQVVSDLKSLGVKIYAVGVGDATLSELERIASSKSDVFYADRYDGAKKFITTLAKSVCRDAGSQRK